MVGRQTPFLALIVPLILVAVVDGKRGMRQTWPAALVAGVTFAIAQFVCSNYISVELTDIIAALVSTFALVGFLRVWKPSEPLLTEPTERAAADDRRRLGPRPGARAQRAPARPVGGGGHDPGEARGVRAVHHHRRRLRAGEARRPDREVPVRVRRRHRLQQRRREDPERLRVAGPQRGRRRAARRRRRPPSRSRSGTRRARSCCSAGCSRSRCCGSTSATPCAPTRSTLQAARAGDRHRDGGPRARLRDEPDRDDGHDRPLDRRRRRRLRLPLADHRLARGCDHRLRHVLERALRGPAGRGREGRRALGRP